MRLDTQSATGLCCHPDASGAGHVSVPGWVGECHQGRATAAVPPLTTRRPWCRAEFWIACTHKHRGLVPNQRRIRTCQADNIFGDMDGYGRLPDRSMFTISVPYL